MACHHSAVRSLCGTRIACASGRDRNRLFTLALQGIDRQRLRASGEKWEVKGGAKSCRLQEERRDESRGPHYQDVRGRSNHRQESVRRAGTGDQQQFARSLCRLMPGSAVDWRPAKCVWCFCDFCWSRWGVCVQNKRKESGERAAWSRGQCCEGRRRYAILRTQYSVQAVAEGENAEGALRNCCGRRETGFRSNAFPNEVRERASMRLVTLVYGLINGHAGEPVEEEADEDETEAGDQGHDGQPIEVHRPV